MEESTPTRSIIQFCATRRGESHSTRAKNKPESHSQAALGDVVDVFIALNNHKRLNSRSSFASKVCAMQTLSNSVSLVSDIPQQVAILVNGVTYRVTHSENLHEVPTCEQLESNSSLGNNISIEPVFNEAMGLYSIKTKYLKNVWPHCSPSSKYQFLRSSLGVLNFEGRSNRASPPSPMLAKKVHEDKLIVEAKEALEVCKSLGLHFKANDAEVINRFIELEVEASGAPK
ncbi:hypothetical protein V6N13_059611 [Hibiscus sabdariffa]